MDTEFLHDIQRAGWAIAEVGSEDVIGTCRSRGCKMAAKLAPGAFIPKVCRPDGNPHDIPIEVWQHIREQLYQRRVDLGLTIKEVETIAGIAIDQLAKCERDGSTRIPNFQTIMEWGMTLGMGFYMRPGNLPAPTLRYIVDTRDLADRRRERAEQATRQAG